MKKASSILSIIAFCIASIGVIISTIYFIINLVNLSQCIMADLAGEDTGTKTPETIAFLIVFLLADIYMIFAVFTAYLTKRVVEYNVFDKIGKFGVLSIIFLNIPGGIVTLIYNKHVQEELKKTAPKGVRKEAQK